MNAVLDQVYHDAHSLWYSNGAVCAGACYMRCCVRTSVNLCASSLQNLAVPLDLIPLSVSLWNDLCDPV